jgi:hypothetical protein
MTPENSLKETFTKSWLGLLKKINVLELLLRTPGEIFNKIIKKKKNSQN